MPLLMDLAYLLAALIAAPVWLVGRRRRGKGRTDWAGRLGRIDPLPAPRAPRLLLYGVSVGEVNALRVLVGHLEALASPPELVLSSTTDTGMARARELFGARHPVVRFPLDLSGAVGRFLDATRPDLVCLIELEVWPNFIGACRRRGIPVGVINGRLTARSYRKYRWIAPLVRPAFARLAFVGAQNDQYARRFIRLGAPAHAVSVTATMKWDAVQLQPDRAAADALADAMGLRRDRPLVVAGSTAPGEHELLDAAVPAGAQLLCAPRRPEWFDLAVAALPGCARRSRGPRGSATDRFVLDTIGELRHAYTLADVVVVGRSFGRLHGSDMMEPAALGKATVIGPSVADFQDTADVLLEADGIVQTRAEDLASVLDSLLNDEQRRAQLVENAAAAIRAHQGATDRHARMLMAALEQRDAGRSCNKISPSRK